MKKLNQHLLLAAAMLTAGVAHAQTTQSTTTTNSNTPTPTNQFSRAPRQIFEVEDPRGANTVRAANMPGVPLSSYSSYSQDSYIEQTSTSSQNYANVNQTGIQGERAAGSGSTAVISQTGMLNNANQTQTANASSNVVNGRSFMRSTQAGSSSQSDQTQVGGYENTALVEQGAGTSGNRAVQSQTDNGFNNGARITQSTASGYSAANNNFATQSQTGNQNLAITEQQGQNGYASQTQSNFFNDAYIGQGAPGTNNTAIQNQSGEQNNARIRQSVGLPAANDNYAEQRQMGYGDQADINQNSSGNFARQDQTGTTGYYQNNNSLINQSNVSSAAYTVQSGDRNQAIVTQH